MAAVLRPAQRPRCKAIALATKGSAGEKEYNAGIPSGKRRARTVNRATTQQANGPAAMHGTLQRGLHGGGRGAQCPPGKEQGQRHCILHSGQHGDICTEELLSDDIEARRHGSSHGAWGNACRAIDG